MTRTAPPAKPETAASRMQLSTIAARLVFSSAPYRMLLRGAAPLRLAQTPSPGRGEPQRGAALLRGELILAGERLSAPDPWAFAAIEGDEDGRVALHGFAWLADLRAEGSEAARKRARALLTGWTERFGEWSALAWRGDVLGRRLLAWLAEYPFLAAGADEAFHSRFHGSVSRQLRHLEHLARLGGAALGPAGHGRIEALAALATMQACAVGGKERLRRSMAALLRELAHQLLPDGGHCERSPAIHFAVLRHLVDLRRVLLAGRHDVPAELRAAIDRMAPMLRLFRHGDGRLALFNDTAEGDAAAIDAVLTLAECSDKVLTSASHTGFQRLEAGATLVLVDAGAPPPPGSDAHAHAGVLSFEMSLGAERLVVNCGARAQARGAWRTAQRATAAHSTLVLGNANSSDVLATGLGRRPRHVICRRDEVEGAILVDASHDGYAPSLGALHRRRLYLAAQGEDLRGEDRLTRVQPGTTTPFAVRFHLHPDVQASLVHDGKAALLRLPSGAGFRFDASGGRLALEESIYLGAAGGPRRSEQIVVESTLAGNEALVKWSLKRLTAN
ncbi:MAG TPA: heparinase II/III family protein [Alphaproteobacteria bacterium]|nr:heparinase II/III family protein [Alphaproteobacteria bacterium]